MSWRFFLLWLLAAGALAMPPLTSLDFSAQGLDRLPDELADFPELVQVDFSFNRLSDFQPPPSLKGLQALALDSNRFERQPPGLAALKSLRYLSMQGNSLTTFSGTGLATLVWLNLESNQIESLHALEAIPGLVDLNLSNNRLAALPAGLARLRQLRDLDLSGNRLTSVGALLAPLKKLQDLDLSRNQLTQVPSGLVGSSLVRLDLSYNRIRQLGPELGRIRNLEYLSLNGNPGLKLDASLAGLRRLKALYVDEASLPGDPQHLRSLMPNTSVVIFSRTGEGPPR